MDTSRTHECGDTLLTIDVCLAGGHVGTMTSCNSCDSVTWRLDGEPAPVERVLELMPGR